MLKSATLGTFWQDSNAGGSSFTRVRCISNGSQVETQIYGAWKKKARANSVPDAAASKRFLRFRKKTRAIEDPALMISNQINTCVSVEEANTMTTEDTSARKNQENRFSQVKRYSSSVEIEIEIPSNDKEVESTRHMVCTLDTEQNGEGESSEEGSCSESGDGRQSQNQNRSRTNSVDMVMARNKIHSFSSNQSCQGCGLGFDTVDRVVVFESDPYHVKCFTCGECSQPVDAAGNFLVLDDGSPLCKECSPTCHVCGEKIVFGHANVLNKDFHEDCLKCSVCNKVFGAISKVYVSGGEPCCAECVTPVFNEAWSPRASVKSAGAKISLATHQEETEAEVEEFMSRKGSHTLPPRLESLSQAVTDLPTAKYHTLLRPSVSVPSSLSNSPNACRRSPNLSLSSLTSVLTDELGVSLLMNFCMEDCSIELVVFWLDAEHFRHFDGNDDDIKLFAHHIMMKYVGYYAELPLNLPKEIEDKITQEMQSTSTCRQDLFDEAQAFVLDKMEREVHPKFLRSRDGQQFLEALVTRDIDRRNRQRGLSIQGLPPVTATVTSFDKRHLDTKFYIYAIEVEESGEKAMIYRRYSEFHALNQALKAAFPNLKLPSLPKKIYFGRSQTRSVAVQRMKELQTYLKNLLTQHPEVATCPILRQFLTQTSTDKEDEAFDTKLLQSTAVM